MPIDNFKQPRRRQNVDGFLKNKTKKSRFGSSDFISRRQISPKSNSARRQIDDFSRPDGFYANRQPLIEVSDLRTSENLSQPPLSHHRNVSDRSPLLGINADSKKNKQKPHLSFRRRFRLWTIRVSVLAIIVLVVVGGLLIGKGFINLRHIFKGGGTAAALEANIDPSQLKGEGDGRVNILLLGIGGAGHDGPDLTDTILLVSVDPVNNKAALLSVPRDLWVKMPNKYVGNYQKINAAYEAGKYQYLGNQDSSDGNQNAINAGFNAVDQTVSKVLGISINYNVLVNFTAFQQAVNTVGGVNVNVPTELYDPTIAWQNNWNPVIAGPGMQVMYGKQALLYVRSRETSSDFARTQRQRAVLVALKNKTLTLGTLSNPLKISQLISAFGNNVRTDISLNNAEVLYNIMKKIDNHNVQSIGLADPPNNFVTTASLDGTSIVEPTAGLFNYSSIQNFVHSSLKDGYIVEEDASITVLNGTSDTGLGISEANILRSYGYNVGTVTNAPTQNYKKTVLVDLTNGKDKYTRHYLEERFHTTATTHLPDRSIQPNHANFVIIIGDDETNNS